MQPELLYSSQGFKMDVLGGQIKTKLDYINIPVLADVTITEGLSLQAGPQIGFLINDKLEAEGGGLIAESNEFGAKSVDFGAVLGAQYKLENGLFFQARYNFGFIEIVDDADLKNGVASLSVGYFF